jgi:hypothetical protein
MGLEATYRTFDGRRSGRRWGVVPSSVLGRWLTRLGATPLLLVGLYAFGGRRDPFSLSVACGGARAEGGES